VEFLVGRAVKVCCLVIVILQGVIMNIMKVGWHEEKLRAEQKKCKTRTEQGIK